MVLRNAQYKISIGNLSYVLVHLLCNSTGLGYQKLVWIRLAAGLISADAY